MGRGLAAQLAASGFLDRGDDPFGHRLDLGVGQRLLARLERHLDGERLLALRHALPGEHVEHADFADERAVGARGGAHHLSGGDLGVEQEGKIAPDRLEIRGFERLAFPFLPGGGNGVEIKLETGNRGIDAEPGEKVGMELSEGAKQRLGPELERARAAGMKP